MKQNYFFVIAIYNNFDKATQMVLFRDRRNQNDEICKMS